MKWIKVKIDYFSDNLKETKAKLLNIFEEVGIKQMEFVDYFSDNSLDYSVNFKNKNDIWSIIGYIIYNRFAQTKLNIIYENINKISKDDKNFMSEIYTLRCSDEEWQEEWKKYFHTVNITPNIVIKPSWDDYEVRGNETMIEIDPGLAFGTGTHETTSLCVEFLEKYAKGKNNLLDIGCGSGILMLIAKKLGINKVTGIDIDEKVEKVVYENFRKNNIENNYKVVIGNLVDDVSKKYDLVVSNILVDVLIELLKNIEKTLENEATVIFSGILKGKEDIFLKETLKYNLKNIDRNEKNNWVSLVFKYKKI